ncbi:MAG: hypothetical protein EBT13_05045, partial [Rhodobacteraceae bacterium]|nr:hypothetical protein [Paracoccaceae bacterium]
MTPEDLVEDLMDGEEISLEGEEEEYSDFQPKSRDEIEGIVQDAVAGAVSFVESEISHQRIKAQKYYDGETDLGHEDGRSKVVATKVRDTIRTVKPSIMRVFLSSTHAVEFIPHGPEDVAAAEQATAFIDYQFNRHNGYKVLNDAFHDALIKKQGIVKAYWKHYSEAQIYSYTNLTDEELQILLDDPDNEVIEQVTEMSMSIDPMGMQVEIPTHSVRINRHTMKGDMCIESVPPEEFFIDRDARSFDDAYVVAHRTEMRVSDLLEMGFEYEDVKDLDTGGTDMFDAESFERQDYDYDGGSESDQDPSMKIVMVTEAYMRMDIDGTGSPILHKFLCGGTDYKLLAYEPCDEIPFAKFEVDPEPHTFYGRSLAEIIIDDQDASTSILRGILDNVALTNNPGMEIVDGAVNIDDLLNNEIGRVVRTKQSGAIREMAIPFVAGSTMPMLQYMDALVEQKTGVLAASGGLSPDSLQNTTATAVSATVQMAAGQVEVMVRNLADGLRSLFGVMLRLYQKNVDHEQVMRLHNQFIPVDPRVWNGGMDLAINVGLGTGREAEKAAAYREILGLQMQLFQQYGPGNGVVGLVNIRNTLSDMLASSGIRNADRYFGQMTQEMEQQMVAQAQQAA